MKILLARSNIGSQTYTFVKAFRALGHEARGLVYGCEKMFTHDGLEVFETYGLRSNPVLGVWKFVRWLTALKRAIDWADVVHWR